MFFGISDYPAYVAALLLFLLLPGFAAAMARGYGTF